MSAARALVSSAVVVVTAVCATAPPIAAPVAAPRAPALLDVDIALIPDDAGRVGGISARYCLRSNGGWPRRIAPENRRALPFLVSAVDDAGRALTVDAEGVDTHALAGCARLVVDVGRLADAVVDRDIALRAGDDLVMTPDLWLWRPEPFDDGALLFVKIDGKADAKVDAKADASDGKGARFDAMVPWAPRDDGRYVVDAATYALKSDAVFGRFDVEEVDVAGARFFVARLDDGRAPPQLTSWLQASAAAVAAVNGGRFPLPRVNVLVVPTHVTRPIVVGFFSRGGGPTATFFVGEGAPDIADDDLEATGRWALTHELSHPLLPPVKIEDPWLNEGLATWHQDLLARRAGMLPDDEAYWRELVRGLQTGAARAAEDKLALGEASARMHEVGAYQHAYWAGVALMLLAEVDARQHGASLDDLVRVARARFQDDHPRSAHELLSALAGGDDAGAAAAATALLAAFEAHRGEPFPPTEPVLAALGVSVDSVGGVHLDDRAPLAAFRRAITAPCCAVAQSPSTSSSGALQ